MYLTGKIKFDGLAHRSQATVHPMNDGQLLVRIVTGANVRFVGNLEREAQYARKNRRWRDLTLPEPHWNSTCRSLGVMNMSA